MALRKIKSHERYAATILQAFGETIMNPDSDLSIEFDKTDEDGNEVDLTAFFHALMNIVPTHLYNLLVQDQKDLLGTNYIANRLIMQYNNQKIKDDEQV